MIINNHELIKELLKRLKTASFNAAILVEGKKDKRALRKLGIGSQIFLLSSNKSLIEISESLAYNWRQVILMLDSDKKGRELTKKMKTHLQDQGVNVNTKLGKSLLRAANSHTVEGILRICDFQFHER